MIQINGSQISALPEDDVPIEVMGVICQLVDVGIETQESAGYVPQFEDEDHGGKSSKNVNSEFG